MHLGGEDMDRWAHTANTTAWQQFGYKPAVMWRLRIPIPSWHHLRVTYERQYHRASGSCTSFLREHRVIALRPPETNIRRCCRHGQGQRQLAARQALYPRPPPGQEAVHRYPQWPGQIKPPQLLRGRLLRKTPRRAFLSVSEGSLRGSGPLSSPSSEGATGISLTAESVIAFSAIEALAPSFPLRGESLSPAFSFQPLSLFLRNRSTRNEV